MNPEERQLLSDFLTQLKQAKGVTKDAEASTMISEAAAAQPDALYLLVQKALLQDQALKSAKDRIAQLQSEARQNAPRPTARAGGFLNRDPWSEPDRRAFGAPGPMAAAAPAAPGGFGSFLGAAAATAAGVAGGAFLFHGLESLLGSHSHGQGFFDQSGGDHDGIDNVTINEYYANDEDEDDMDSDVQDADYEEPQDDDMDAYGDDDEDSFSV